MYRQSIVITCSFPTAIQFEISANAPDRAGTLYRLRVGNCRTIGSAANPSGRERP